MNTLPTDSVGPTVVTDIGPDGRLREPWVCPVVGCLRAVMIGTSAKSAVFTVRGHFKKHHPALTPPLAPLTGANPKFGLAPAKRVPAPGVPKPAAGNSMANPHVLPATGSGVDAVTVNLHHIEEPSGLNTEGDVSLACGHAIGVGGTIDWYMFVVSGPVARDLRRAAGWWVRNGLPDQRDYWVRVPLDRVVATRQSSHMAVGMYRGATIVSGVANAKPTLITGQGVIMMGATGGGYRVQYDPTDPLARDCQWEPGTIITDLPVSTVDVDRNWRIRITP